MLQSNPPFRVIHPAILEFDEAVTPRDLEELARDPRVRVLQRSSPVSEAVWDCVNAHFFAHRPDVQLRVYGHYWSECDLSFATRMTNVRRFAADCLTSATNVECIAAIPNLEMLSLGIFELTDFRVLEDVSRGLTELSLGATRSKKPDLAPLARFRSLRKLFLEGQSKNIEVLSGLRELSDLTLRSITTPDLRYLAPLTNLWSLDIKLGGIRSFTGIEGKASIKYLELWQIRGLSDVRIVAALPGLQNLFLQSLPQVTRFPSLRDAAHLRRVLLINMKGLSDFSGLEWAPALEEFGLAEGSAQEPEQLLPVLRNRSVRRVRAHFGSERQNQRFSALREESGKEEPERWTEFEYR
jgi:hypothetical protein